VRGATPIDPRTVLFVPFYFKGSDEDCRIYLYTARDESQSFRRIDAGNGGLVPELSSH
jgi:hypothetical protein